MNELIKVTDRTIGGSDVQTVNARDLHVSLDVKKDFSDWFKAQASRARLVEGRDFVSSPSKGISGQNRIDYHLTLDAGKQVAMMSETDRGFDVRDYFLECERRALAPAAPAVKPSALSPAKEFRALYGIAKLIGMDKNAAAISANQGVARLTGTNMLDLLGQTHIAADNDIAFFTPTELGKRIGVSGQKMNALLTDAGLRIKCGESWDVTAIGKPFARLYDTGKKHNSGVPVQQVKWTADVIEAVHRPHDPCESGQVALI